MSQRLLVSTQEPADRALECQWWHMFALCLQSANVTCGCTSFYVAGHKSVQVRLGLELEIPKKMATHLTTPFQYFMYFPFGCIEANISKCQGGRKLISGRFGDPCAPCMPWTRHGTEAFRTVKIHNRQTLMCHAIFQMSDFSHLQHPSWSDGMYRSTGIRYFIAPWTAAQDTHLWFLHVSPIFTVEMIWWHHCSWSSGAFEVPHNFLSTAAAGSEGDSFHEAGKGWWYVYIYMYYIYLHVHTSVMHPPKKRKHPSAVWDPLCESRRGVVWPLRNLCRVWHPVGYSGPAQLISTVTRTAKHS